MTHPKNERDNPRAHFAWAPKNKKSVWLANKQTKIINMLKIRIYEVEPKNGYQPVFKP